MRDSGVLARGPGLRASGVYPTSPECQEIRRKQAVGRAFVDLMGTRVCERFRWYVYSYVRNLSDLYLVEGLK